MKTALRLIILISIILLPACIARLESPSPGPQTTLPVSSTPLPPSDTPTATDTQTTPRGPTPSPSATLLPSLTATPTPVPPVRFAVIGDYGKAGPDEQAVAEMVIAWNPDFIITTGDNNYPDGAAETIDENIGQFYHVFIYPYLGSYGLGAESNRFFPSLGNHDWHAADAQPYLDYFTLPGNERYYTFKWGSLQFFALDSDTEEPDGTGRSTNQAKWLQSELAGSIQTWKIVYFHHAPYSSGEHGPTKRMQWPFRDWGADVILSGHDHTYERLEVDGLFYFISGLGGHLRYAFPIIQPGSLLRYNDGFGAMLVTATQEQITFEFYAAPGTLIDRYTLLADR